MAESAGESRRHRYLRAMQVDVWLRRGQGPQGCAETAGTAPGEEKTAGIDAIGIAPQAPVSRATEVAAMPLAELESTVAGCLNCDLHQGRTRTVFGTGDAQARCMIIGEAPGAEEDRTGEPFVGRAGHAVDLRDLQRLVAIHRRQNSRKTSSE